MLLIPVTCNIRLRDINEEEYSVALPWYSDEEILKNSEGLNATSYDIEKITQMYDYLKSSGELYFIEVLEDGEWLPIGDVSLLRNDMPICIGNKKYHGKGIGKLVILKMIELARYKGIHAIEVMIYAHNKKSQDLFTGLGFKKVNEHLDRLYYKLSI